MRRVVWLMIATMACVGLLAQAYARSIPKPGQPPTAGNEARQVPLSQAGYSNATNFELQCVGCHLSDGEGSPGNDTPRMKDFVGHFLKVEGGREFLVRVPGASQSALTDRQLADLLNWLLRADGMAGTSMPAQHVPYTEEEVATHRRNIILNLPETRARLIAQMREQGIAITDGLDSP